MNAQHVPGRGIELAGGFEHYADVVRAENALDAARAENSQNRAISDQPCRVIMSGNCTVDFAFPGLRVGLAAEGFAAEVEATEYGDTIGAVLDGEIEGDFWIFWLSSMGFSKGATARLEVDVPGLAAAAERVIDRGRKVIVVLPESLETEDGGQSAFTPWRRDLCRRIETLFPPQTVFVEPELLRPFHGKGDWYGAPSSSGF